MAQFARPSADTDNSGSFTNQSGGNTNLYQAIDEDPASDLDYIQSPADPSSAVYVTKLSAITDPSSSSGHIIRARMGTDQSSGGSEIDATVELREGYESEASQGTLIATLSQENISQGSFTTYTKNLSSGEADSITDYSDLFLRIVFTVGA